MEPLDEHLAQLAQCITEVEAQSMVDQLKLTKECENVDTHFSQRDATLTNLARCPHIIKKITKNWNKMEQELTTMNIEIAAVRMTQTALQHLLEGMAQQMEGLIGFGTTQGEEVSKNVM